MGSQHSRRCTIPASRYCRHRQSADGMNRKNTKSTAKSADGAPARAAAGAGQGPEKAASGTRQAPGDGIELGGLPQLVGYQMRLAQVAIFRDFNAALGEYDITPGLYGVLEVIAANPGLKQTQLARAVQLDRSSVVSVIDKLERRALVSRRVAAGDRRSNALELTADGLALLRRLRPRVRAHEERLAARLSASERATLMELLARVFPGER